MTQLALIDPGPKVDLLDVETCQTRWQVAPGEVFLLAGQAEHVLACGDSRDRAVAERTMALALQDSGRPERVLVVDDPPYGLGYRSGSVRRMGDTKKPLPLRRADRELDGGDEFDPSFMPVWRDVATPDAVYLFSQWTVSARWRLAMQLAGWPPRARIVWDKMSFGMGAPNSYGDQTEDVFVWYRDGISPRWAKREGNIWVESRGVCLEGGMVGHPTPKPFGLYRRPIEHMTSPDDLVIDPHAGSGTGLIVSDGLRRRSIAVDSSPRYCALMLERCERYGIHLTDRRMDPACLSSLEP